MSSRRASRSEPGTALISRRGITVTARKGGLQGSAIVRSIIETRVPTDRLAELTIFLSRICAGRRVP